MYWITKKPCPKCDTIFPLEELDYIRKIIKRELGYEPSNGWPPEWYSSAGLGQDIGLVKIRSGSGHYLRCFACDFTVPEKDYQKFIDKHPEKVRAPRRVPIIFGPLPGPNPNPCREVFGFEEPPERPSCTLEDFGPEINL